METKRDIPDRSKININEPVEVRYWTKHLSISREELLKAVEKVGNGAAAVKKELGHRKATAQLDKDERAVLHYVTDFSIAMSASGLSAVPRVATGQGFPIMGAGASTAVVTSAKFWQLRVVYCGSNQNW